MKFFIFFIALIIFSTISVGSGNPGVPGIDGPVEEPADCHYFKNAEKNNSDPFEPGVRFYLPQDKKWHCLDTRRRRSIQILSKDDNIWTVANFWHKNRFWVAQIPTDSDSIAQIDFVEEMFPAIVPAAHTFLVIKMKADHLVLLTPQVGFENRSTAQPKQEQIKDLVFTIEAVGQPGFRYDLIKGERGYFSIAYRLTSLEDRAVWMLELEKHHGKQWPLNFSNTQRAELVRAALLKSDGTGLAHKYDTLSRNCTNELFRLFDKVLNFTGFQKLYREMVFLRETLPTFSMFALEKRKLINRAQLKKPESFNQDLDVVQAYSTRP